MHGRARRLAILLAVVLGAVFASSGVAWATIAVTAPTQNPFTVPGDAAGDPLPFTISVSGLNQFQPAFAVECDGVSPQTPGYTVSEHCDNASSGSSVNGDASGNATFAADSQNNHLRVFKGESPQSFFNCLSPNDPDPNDGLPSFRNCQVRVSAGTLSDTSNQQFFTVVLPDATGQTTTTTSSTTTTTGPTTTSTTIPGASTTTTTAASTTTVQPATTTTVQPTTTTTVKPTTTSTTTTTKPTTTTTAKPTTTTVAGGSTTTSTVHAEGASTTTTVSSSGTTVAISGSSGSSGSDGSGGSSGDSSSSDSSLPTTGSMTWPLAGLALLVLGAGVALAAGRRQGGV